MLPGIVLVMLQVLPPSVLARTIGAWLALSPEAKQSEVVGHEIPVRSTTPLGMELESQMPPPSVLANAIGSLPLSPEAKQSEVVGQEISVRPVTAGPSG